MTTAPNAHCRSTNVLAVVRRFRRGWAETQRCGHTIRSPFTDRIVSCSMPLGHQGHEHRRGWLSWNGPLMEIYQKDEMGR